MASIVSVIGLGEIGASIAAALKAQDGKFHVIGVDLRKDAEERAEKSGAVDEIVLNVYDAVANADFVILAIPADETKSTLELIGPDLRKTAVVSDCCPVKTAAAGWARAYMTHPENFVGIWLGEAMYVCPDSKTSEAAVNMTSELARALEKECFFTDPAELDGILAADWHLPVMMGYSLVGCLSGRSGWADGKKACGKEFRSAAAPLYSVIDREEAGTALLNNRENNIRVINEYMAELKKLRELLQNKDANGLRTYMEDTGKSIDQWLKDYQQSNIAASDTSPKVEVNAAETLRQTFFGGFLRNKKKD